MLDWFYCGECQCLVSPEEAISVGLQDTICNVCDNIVCTAEQELEDYEFWCDKCGRSMTFGDGECIMCDKTFSMEYWDSYLAEWVAQNYDAIPVPTISPSDAYQLTLCCNKWVYDCTCAKTITWETGKVIPKDIDYEAYEYGSNCSSCEHYYTPDCLPYRAWMIEYLRDGVVAGAIDVCSFYSHYSHNSTPFIYSNF